MRLVSFFLFLLAAVLGGVPVLGRLPRCFKGFGLSSAEVDAKLDLWRARMAEKDQAGKGVYEVTPFFVVVKGLGGWVG